MTRVKIDSRCRAFVAGLSVSLAALAAGGALAHESIDPSLPPRVHAGLQDQRVDTTSPVPRTFVIILRDGAERSAPEVEKYFAGYGFKTSYSADANTIELVGTYGQAEAAGHFNYVTETGAHRIFTRPSQKPSFGRDIDAAIEATSFGASLRGESYEYLTGIPLTGYTPAALAKAYDAPSGIDGTGRTVDLFGCGNFSASDMTKFNSKFGLKNTQPTKIAVDGGGTGAADGEVTLDIQRVHATAPGASIREFLLPATCDVTDWVTVYNKVLTDQTAHPADALSISYGIGEGLFLHYTSGVSVLNAQSAILKKLLAKGVTIFASTGDSGSFRVIYPWDPSVAIDVNYPSSDISVLSVGGTTLYASPAGARISGNPEAGWSGSLQIITSGGEFRTGSTGGVSAKFALPSWQTGEAGLADKSRKNLPDVSYDADPYTGEAIVLNGTVVSVGGTSASSPSWAGIIALINQARAKAGHGKLANVAAALYAKQKTAFLDIQAGNNGFFSAKAGYDNVTGIGVPDIAKLVAALK